MQHTDSVRAETLGKMTADDIYFGRCEEILKKHVELRKTFLERKDYNIKIIVTGIEIVS